MLPDVGIEYIIAYEISTGKREIGLKLMIYICHHPWGDGSGIVCHHDTILLNCLTIHIS